MSRHDPAAGCDALRSPWSAALPFCTVHTTGEQPGNGHESSATPCRNVSWPQGHDCIVHTVGLPASYVPHSTVQPSTGDNPDTCTDALVSMAFTTPPGIENAPGRYALPRAATFFRSFLL